MKRHTHAALGLLGLACAVSMPAHAHNKLVHKGMPELAYEIIKSVSWEHAQARGTPIGDPSHAPPGGWEPLGLLMQSDQGTPDPAWQQFMADTAAAYLKLQGLKAGLPSARVEPCVTPTWSLPSGYPNERIGDLPVAINVDYVVGSGCGIDLDWRPGGIYDRGAHPGGFTKDDATGNVLGFWAASIDDEADDTHIFVKVLNAGFLGDAKGSANNFVTNALAAPLIPIICFAKWLFGGDDCEKDAHDFANAVNPIDKIDGLIPGFGDISGNDYITMWHFMNLQSGVSNLYDDHQGLYYPEAGLDQVADPVDILIMAGLGLAGMTLNESASEGPHRYQVSTDDGHSNSVGRGTATWQFASLSHTPLSPLDNLAYFGWSRFREDANAHWLGWPLHALGDASAPHHLIGSSGWGHRPFEDAVERHWREIRFIVPLAEKHPEGDIEAQIAQAQRILQSAFRWRLFILKWRQDHPGKEKDVPIRDLVTELGNQQLSAVAEQGNWPFNLTVSSEYLLSSEDAATSHYDPFVDKMRDGVEDGTGAILAFLVSAAEAH